MMLGPRSKERHGEPAADPGREIHADLTDAVISGQVAIGEHIVQIHADHGAVVNYLAADERPTPRLRAMPVHRLPRDFPALLGRDEELATVEAALSSDSPVELCGEPGIGKTVLLRHFVRRPSGAAPRDGVIYTTARAHRARTDRKRGN